MSRDHARVERLLEVFAACAADPSRNVMLPTIELVKARASMGEIVQRLKAVYGRYVEAPVF
jgi:methylmalonyl-CoA mutase N-terminal domain/subunit